MKVDTAQALSLLIGVVLPILVGIVTTKATHAGVKAVLLALLSAASGFLTEFASSAGSFDWATAGLTWLGTFMVAVATHFGFWRPTGATEAVQKIGVTDRR